MPPSAPALGGPQNDAPPTISVIMPIYNGARFLPASIGSVIAQTLQPMELICVDDGSTDGSREMLETIETPFPKFVLHQDRKRQSAACNLGAAQARGKYIAFLDQDDIWYPRALEKLVAPLEEDARLGWSYSNIDEIDPDGHLVTLNILPTLNPLVQHPKTSLYNMLGADMVILSSSALLRRDAFVAVGGFDERLSGYEDDDLFLRLFFDGWLNTYLTESQVRYRRHPTSSAFSGLMPISREIYARKLIEMFPDDPVLVRFYVRDIIAPRFYATARVEYVRHFPHRRWDDCLAALELMRKYTALQRLPLGPERLRRALIFRIMAYPRVLMFLYPVLWPIRRLGRF